MIDFPGPGDPQPGADVSNTDSFIDEVTEEVRRDRLFGYMRRYGWIAVLVVLLLVGGAAWSEWRKATARAEAEALGDALLAALEIEDDAERVAALAAVPADGPEMAVVALLTAAEKQRAGDTAGAIATLDALATAPDVSALYRDLAGLKSLMLAGDTIDPNTRRAALEVLATPGAPFALLAREQLALADLAAGDRDAAIATLRAIIEDAGTTQGLRDRTQGLIVALGEDVSDTTADQ